MKIAHYDNTTRKILGWYSSDIHTVIPTPNIEVSDVQWDIAINNNHNKVLVDGSTEENAGLIDQNSINTVQVEKKKLQKYFEDTNKWDFVKRLRNAKPTYTDTWEGKPNVTTDDEILIAVSTALGISTQDMLNAAEAVDLTPPILDAAAELEAKKDIAKALISTERDRRKYLPITYDTHLYSVSEWDITMISSLLAESRFNDVLPTGDYWKTFDNANVNLSKTDLENINNAIRTQIQVSYAWSWTKKAEIDASVDITTVDAIDLEITIN